MRSAVAIALVAALAGTPAVAQRSTPGGENRAADPARGTDPARGADPVRGANDNRAVPGSRAQLQLSFAPIVRDVSASVVNVYGARVEKTPRMAMMDDFFRRFFGDASPNVPHERTQRSLGSGVIVDPSGLVVTNHHVIENMTEVKVALADRREVEAEIVLRDPRADLAVLRLKGGQGHYRALEIGDADALEVGDVVLALGNPFGVGQTVTQGIVSGLARTNIGVSEYGYFIQTDAAINPGNSGGALVDMQGRLVGINSAIYSQSGGSIGIGFAIPSTMVKAVVTSAEAGAKAMQRPWLGASLQSVSPDIADGLGLDPPTGALVASVRDDGPAKAAGLRSGDVVLDVDGRPVDDPDAFGWRFALKGITGTTPITINRGGKRQVLTLRLQAPPETPPRDPVTPKGRTPFTGATFVNLSPAVSDEMRVKASDGVVVADVEEGSIADRVGLQKGDVVVALNGQPIASTRDIGRLTGTGAPSWQVSINRGGQILTSVFGG